MTYPNLQTNPSTMQNTLLERIQNVIMMELDKEQLEY